MRLLHNIGPRLNSNYNSIEEILACEDFLSFDGVYLNVWQHRDILRYHGVMGDRITLFVMGDYVGLDNTFDKGQKLERYCDWAQIEELARTLDARVGWHSWSHRDLTKLSDNEILKEITYPHHVPVKTFAYPYGRVDQRVADIVERSGLYEDAWSVHEGNGTRFQKHRSYLNW